MGDAQDLDEQALNLRQEALAERAQGVIWMRVGGESAKRQRVVDRLFDAPAPKRAGRIALDQQPQQPLWVIRRRARAADLTGKPREIPLFDNFHHEARQRILGQPIIDRGRQQVGGLTITLTEEAQARSL